MTSDGWKSRLGSGCICQNRRGSSRGWQHTRDLGCSVKGQAVTAKLQAGKFWLAARKSMFHTKLGQETFAVTSLQHRNPVSTQWFYVHFSYFTCLCYKYLKLMYMNKTAPSFIFLGSCQALQGQTYRPQPALSAWWSSLPRKQPQIRWT